MTADLDTDAGRATLLASCPAPDNKATINNLLPERFDSPRQEFMAQRLMREPSLSCAANRRPERVPIE